ncbi:hypothetical protein J2S53_002541 [Actinopolyspora lacussalsi]|nr:hypothetical protein [Actinopolyspora lacussalsi]
MLLHSEVPIRHEMSSGSDLVRAAVSNPFAPYAPEQFDEHGRDDPRSHDGRPHRTNPGDKESRLEVALSSSDSTMSEPDTEQSARIFV